MTRRIRNATGSYLAGPWAWRLTGSRVRFGKTWEATSGGGAVVSWISSHAVGLGVLAPCLLLLSRAAIASRLRRALARGRIAVKRAIMVGEREELDHRSAPDLLRKYAIREVGRFELPQVGGDDRTLTTDSVAVLDAAVDVARTGQEAPGLRS